MGEQGYQVGEKPSGSTESLDTELPIIASVRTGLAGKDKAILRRVPVDYSGKSVKNVLDYLLGTEDLNSTEIAVAESVRKELIAARKAVTVNGKTAGLDDKLSKYLIMKEHELPDGSKRQYRELEIEVSAVKEGGLYSLLR